MGLISSAVCEATGLTDNEAREKLHSLMPEKKLDKWHGRYQNNGLDKFYTDKSWAFLADCIEGFPDPAGAMIKLIKEENNG